MERLSTLLKAVQEICGRGSYDSNSVSVVVLFHSRKIIFLSVATLLPHSFSVTTSLTVIMTEIDMVMSLYSIYIETHNVPYNSYG